MKKMNNKHGFTLAELLIVVAIIAVLVAISIPIFTTQLEKSREAVDFANVRAAYAEVMTAALTEDGQAKTSASGTEATIKQSDGSYKAVVKLQQAKNGWTTDTTGMDIGGVKVASWAGSPTANGTCTIVFTPGAADGSTSDSLTITWA